MALCTALIDNTTHALLALGFNPAAIAFVNECTMDTVMVPAVNLPNYKKEFFLLAVPAREHHKWSWNVGTRTFTETPYNMQTEELLNRSRLAVAKMSAYIFMSEHINCMRYKLHTNVHFQDVVYLEKQLEAQRFKDSGYDESLILELPYVAQYAEYANIPLAQAADEILLQAKLDHEFLAKTENLRLELKNRLKRAANVQEVNDVIAFIRKSPN